MNLEGKVVVITGAYSGLGAALSEVLAKKGCKVVLAGRNQKELLEFSDKIRNITDVHSVIMDVRRKDDCEMLIEETIKKFGRIDILINNAGIWKISSIDKITEDDVNDMFQTNTFGPLWCTKAALEIMKKQGSGLVVNIGSTAAIDHRSRNPLYASSKSALVSISGCLANDLKDTDIRIVCFCPGGMKTGLFRHNPERFDPNFMDPNDAANYLVKFIESDSDEWLVVLRNLNK